MSEPMERIVNQFDDLMNGINRHDQASIAEVKSLLHKVIDAATPSQLAILFLGPRVIAERTMYAEQMSAWQSNTRKKRTGNHK